jgi:hypothetical protein
MFHDVPLCSIYCLPNHIKSPLKNGGTPTHPTVWMVQVKRPSHYPNALLLCVDIDDCLFRQKKAPG